MIKNIRGLAPHMVRFDRTEFDEMVEGLFNNNDIYLQNREEIQKAIKAKDIINIESCLSYSEVLATEIVYSKAFNDGVKYILGLLKGAV